MAVMVRHARNLACKKRATDDWTIPPVSPGERTADARGVPALTGDDSILHLWPRCIERLLFHEQAAREHVQYV